MNIPDDISNINSSPVMVEVNTNSFHAIGKPLLSLPMETLLGVSLAMKSDDMTVTLVALHKAMSQAFSEEDFKSFVKLNMKDFFSVLEAWTKAGIESRENGAESD
jgi:hypothetical protein